MEILYYFLAVVFSFLLALFLGSFKELGSPIRRYSFKREVNENFAVLTLLALFIVHDFLH